MKENSQVYLATEKIGVLMRKYSLPCIISLLVGALYNIVDQIFIANADYLGSYGNAANTVVFPLTVIALAIAVMIGDGCCAFVSLCLGKKEPQNAGQSVGNAIVLTLVASIVLTVIYLVFMDTIIAMFGGTVNDETFRYSKEYFFWITLGIPFYMFGQALNPVIRADGNPRFAMISTLVGAILNVILDPIFIFIFKWGMMGAAVATVIGQIVTAILTILYLCKPHILKLTKHDFGLKWNATPGHLQFLVSDFFSSRHGSHQQYDSEIRQFGSDIRPSSICADSHGRGGHCHEVFPDCHFDCRWYGSRLHSHCWL